MSWLALHPQEIADRAKGGGLAKPGLTLPESVALGSIGFMLVSVAGFAPWALAGRSLHHAVGEVGLYAACAVVLIGLSGAVLHRLIIGPWGAAGLAFFWCQSRARALLGQGVQAQQ